MTVLIDTGPIVATVNEGDSHHRDVMTCIERITESIVVPITVLPEVDSFLMRRLGLQVAIRGLELATQDFQLESVLASDLPRIFELMRQYVDNPIGFVDASIVAVAERLGVRRILTLDRRHFGQIRPRHCDALTLLP
jgi:hypothetical protein